MIIHCRASINLYLWLALLVEAQWMDNLCPITVNHFGEKYRQSLRHNNKTTDPIFTLDI